LGAVLHITHGKLNMFKNKRSVNIYNYSFLDYLDPELKEAKPLLKFYQREFPSDFERLRLNEPESEQLMSVVQNTTSIQELNDSAIDLKV
jgi:hypothetical protein